MVKAKSKARGSGAGVLALGAVLLGVLAVAASRSKREETVPAPGGGEVSVSMSIAPATGIGVGAGIGAAPPSTLIEGAPYVLSVTVTNNSTRHGAPAGVDLDIYTYALSAPDGGVPAWLPNVSQQLAFAAGQTQTITRNFTIPKGTFTGSGTVYAEVYPGPLAQAEYSSSNRLSQVSSGYSLVAAPDQYAVSLSNPATLIQNLTTGAYATQDATGRYQLNEGEHFKGTARLLLNKKHLGDPAVIASGMIQAQIGVTLAIGLTGNALQMWTYTQGVWGPSPSWVNTYSSLFNIPPSTSDGAILGTMLEFNISDYTAGSTGTLTYTVTLDGSVRATITIPFVVVPVATSYGASLTF